MQKTTTPLKTTDLIKNEQKLIEENEMQPSAKTLKNILQFAAAYRVQKVSQNQFAEMIIN